MNGDRSLFFMTLAIICMWLVLDEFLGKKRISGWIASVMGSGSSSEPMTVPETNSVTSGLKDGNVIAENDTESMTYVPNVKVPITRPDDRDDQPTYDGGGSSTTKYGVCYNVGKGYSIYSYNYSTNEYTYIKSGYSTRQEAEKAGASMGYKI